MTTPPSIARAELRAAIRAGHSMDTVSYLYRQGCMSEAAFIRYERLWAWSTATVHHRTRGVSLETWRSRRDRICRAVRAVREA